MSPRIQFVVARYRNALEQLYAERFSRMVLFGSRARGDSREDSDIDVLVVLHGTVDPNMEMWADSDILAALCLENNVVLTPVYISESDYEHRQSPLLMNIRREGVLV